MYTVYVYSNLCVVMLLKEGSIVEDDLVWKICFFNGLKGSKTGEKTDT